jgi:hypothetical protein
VLYACVFFSLALTTWGVQKPRRLIWALPAAFVLSAWTLFSTEYFFGMELLRPLLAWFALAGGLAGGLPRGLARVRRVLLSWLPFVALIGGFAIWRTVFHPFGGGGSEGLLSGIFYDPLAFLAQLPGRILQDTFEAFMGAWGLAFNYAPLIESGGVLYAVLAVLVGLAFWLYLARIKEQDAPGMAQIKEQDAPGMARVKDQDAPGMARVKEQDAPGMARVKEQDAPGMARIENQDAPGMARIKEQDAPERWAIEASLFGLLAFLAAGLPIWLTRLPFSTSFPWDRFALVFGPGVCVLTAGLLSWLGKTPGRRAFLVALLVGLSSGVNNAGAAEFRKDWNAATDFFWQLAWRAPAIQAGTAVLYDQIGLRYFEDDSLSAPFNWMYAPDAQSPRMDYLLLNIPERLNGLGYLNPVSPISKDFRAMAFSGSTSQALVIKYNAPGCLQILDPQRDGLRIDLPEFARRALPLSRLELIQAQAPAGKAPAAPPGGIFGPEPKHKWCYYYEQAELARQSGNWDKILELKGQSIGAGYFPEDAAEYLPFVEALLRKGDWNGAHQLSKRAYDSSAGNGAPFCALWQRAGAWSGQSADYPAALRAIQTLMQCTE